MAQTLHESHIEKIPITTIETYVAVKDIPNDGMLHKASQTLDMSTAARPLRLPLTSRLEGSQGYHAPICVVVDEASRLQDKNDIFNLNAETEGTLLRQSVPELDQCQFVAPSLAEDPDCGLPLVCHRSPPM